ncbi:HutD family protein [Anaerovorax odorimutans]|uniref:HutD family protein n=1 Tax=Anaerovorax odorimutans TaxID=109327 RepID=A0ABT1RN04_9FIRM|nr:HutD family protein [Anaerovorax odorimutans]MCQ4636564.1 HutD family protein [Anaerovorax odorimutans]
MNYKLYKEENFHTGRWSGGETKELAIFPGEASYGERNFIWRLSLATGEQEVSAFTSLPHYDRVLVVLEGDTVLAYEGQRVIRLKELEQDRFDGGFSTKSFGKTKDYNLMVRKGGAGYLDVLELTEERQVPEREPSEGKAHSWQAFYCHEGCGVVTFGEERQVVRPGEQLVIYSDAGEETPVDVMGEGVLIRAQIFHDDLVLPAEDIAGEKGFWANLAARLRAAIGSASETGL